MAFDWEEWKGEGKSRKTRFNPQRVDLLAGFAQGAHQSQEGLAFQLTDPLAGQAEVFAHLTKGHGGVWFQAEPHPDHGGFAVVELAEPREDSLEVVRLDQGDRRGPCCVRR